MSESKLKCSFSFGQLEELLARMHSIAPDRKVAFQGRLKHLQRWGFPTREKPGKGKAIAYTIEHVFRAVLALEFIQAGINPKFAIDMIEANWGEVLPTIYLNSFTGSEAVTFGGGSEHDWCWLVRPEALRALTVEGESEYDQYEAIHPISADQLIKVLAVDAINISGTLGAHWRNLVINGGPLVRGVIFLIDHEFGWAKRDDLISDLNMLVGQRQARLESLFASFDRELGDLARQGREDRARRGADAQPYSEMYPELISEAAVIAEIIPSGMEAVFGASEGESVQISEENLRFLADRRLVRVDVGEIAFTPLFFVVSELLRGKRDGGNSQA